MSSPTTKKGIMILGHPRSGTTLTRRLFNAHTQIACPPETHLFSACVRFLESEKTAFGVDIGALAGLNFAGVDDKVVLNKLREFAFSFLDDYAHREGKPRWAEKTAFDAFHIEDIEQFCGEHVTFIGIIRHPLDVAMSSIKFCDSMGFYPKEMHKYICKYPHPIEAFVHSWLDVTQNLLDLSERQPNNCKVHRYEDLVSSPQETLTKMLTFLGEKFEEKMIQDGLQQGKSLGFGDHKSYQSNQVHNQSIGKWSNLPEHQLQKLAIVLNPMLERLGYKKLEEKKSISVVEARHQYLTSMDILAKRGQGVKPKKTEPSPRISVYGKSTDSRSSSYHEEIYTLNEKLCSAITELDSAPVHLFSIVLLTLLRRIGEENHLSPFLLTNVSQSSQDKNEYHGVTLNAGDKPCFRDLIENLSSYCEQNKDTDKLHTNFDVVVNYSPYSGSLEAAVAKLEQEESKKSALSLSILASNNESNSFTLCFSFNDSVWSEKVTRQKVIQHFRLILEAATNDVNQGIDSFSLLTEDETHLLTNNKMFDEFPVSLIERFMSQAEQRPSHPAVVYDDEILTYAALSRRVCILSNLLRSKGVESGKTVAVCLERSTNLLTTLLAVMHSGGTYIPIDPGFPQIRISQILEDADPHHILTEEKSKDKIDISFSNKIFCLEDDLWESSIETMIQPHESGKLAYIIFTSGSTGRPKGVEVYHHGLTTFLEAMSEKPGLNKNDRMLSVTTISFDIAALELYLPLIVGATVCIANRSDTINGKALQDLFIRQRITCFQATPATYHLLLASDWPGDPALKLLCGGEAMPPELSANLLGKCSSLWNMYGPTETTIWSTVKEVDTVLSPMPIGQAIRGTQTYVLNSELARVPIGVPGELFIAGDGVAKGYYNRSDLTEAAFISNPFSGSDEVMYRTGDLVRVLDGGDIVYLGRLDNQVKIRGFRIELGEIETAIKKMSGVEQCVVGVFENAAQLKSLVAYIISDGIAEPIDINRLREYLQPLIPGYMIPSFVKNLEAFPLTPNNKIDRKALPSLMDTEAISANESSATENQKNQDLAQRNLGDTGGAENQVIASWKKIMGLQNISSRDSFISLGGDSLSYVQVTIELEKILGTFPDGWEEMTIHDLSQGDAGTIPPEAIIGQSTTTKDCWKSNFIDLDTTIFVRAFAIASIVFLHALPDWGVFGNTGALFIVAGLLFAKFQFGQVASKESVKPIFWSGLRVFIPCTVIMTIILLSQGELRLDALLLYSNFTAPVATYWYVQVLLQIMLTMAILFAIKPVLLFAKSEPFKFGIYLLAFMAILMLLSPLFEPEHGKHRQLPQVRFWQFLIGWCIFFANTTLRRITIAHLLILISLLQFALLDRDLGLADPLVTVFFGMLLMITTKISIIRPLHHIVYALAGASLFIFLSHRSFFAVTNELLSLSKSLESIISVPVALAGGYLLWLVWESLSKKLWKNSQ